MVYARGRECAGDRAAAQRDASPHAQTLTRGSVHDRQAAAQSGVLRSRLFWQNGGRPATADHATPIAAWPTPDGGHGQSRSSAERVAGDFSCRRSSARRRSPWPRSGWCRTSTSRGDGRSPPRCYTACWCASSVAIACIGGGGIIAAGRRRVSPHRHGPACYESSCATSPFGCARVGRGHSPVR